MSCGDRIIFAREYKARTVIPPMSAASLLRMSPVDAGQQITELRGRDRHHAVGRARPQEAAAFQAFREQARSLAIVPNHLQQVAATSTETKQMNDRSADRDAESPGPAKPATGNPSACRCSRSQATPVRSAATRSSPPPVGQRRDRCRQRCTVHRARDPHAGSARKLDLDRPATAHDR